MANFKFNMDEVIKIHLNLQGQFNAIASFTLYDAAEVMAAGLKAAAQTLPTEPRNTRSTTRPRLQTLSPEQKRGLVNNVTVRKFKRKNGTIETTVTFGGYNDFKTEKWPKGQPNLMIAASVVQGTSVHSKYDFIKKAEKEYKRAVENEIKTKAAQYMEKAAEGKPFK